MKFDQLPKEIMLELSDRCNLDCQYCFRSYSSPKGNVIDWIDFCTLVDKLTFVDRIAFCGMGEQLLHPRFYDCVAYAGEKKKKVALITNGTIKLDYARLQESSNVEVITFSVDGTNADIIQRSCSKYQFSKLIENLENGSAFKRMKKAINCVMSDKNIENVAEMAKFCKRYRIGELNMLLPSYSIPWITSNLVRITEVLAILKKECEIHHIRYSGPYEMYCLYEGQAIPFITAKGLLRPCCDHFNRVRRLGNVLEQEFEELWNSRVYKKFQEGTYCIKCNMYASLPKRDDTMEVI